MGVSGRPASGGSMLRNYLVTALRNMERNRLYAAITILGLATAFTAAILIGHFVRGEVSYDHWIPGYQRVYKIASTVVQPSQPPTPADIGQSILGSQIRAVFPGAQAIARLDEAFPPVKARPGDTADTDRTFAWADPDIFKVFPLPVLAGDLGSALERPDTVVITRNMARHYFHRDLPIGDILMVQTTTPPPLGSGPLTPAPPAWHPMRVTAVLKDLPSNTNLVTEVFASARSAYSELAIADAAPPNYGGGRVYTFVRLKPGVSPADLQRALDVATGPESALAANYSAGAKWLFHGTPLGEAHLTPTGGTAVTTKPTGSRVVAYGVAGVGALIVLVAAINFVTLMTARAARRGVEVGVRKAAGARRGDLMAQFIGEALIQVAFAALIAAALAEALIKPFSAFTQRELAVDFVHDPALAAGVVGAALVLGLLAAAYPALVLSSFRPAAVLKSGPIQAGGLPAARTTLVVVQFAILVCLIATTVTIYRQTQFALAQGLGATDSKLMVAVAAPCKGSFSDEVRKLPGVAGAACSSYSALDMLGGKSMSTVQIGGGGKTAFSNAPVDFGFFELYGVKPLAGRLFQRDHGEDRVLADPNTAAQPTVVINETAARALGFSDPRAANGKQLNWARGRPSAAPSMGPPPIAPSGIIGVVPDMPVTVRAPTDPAFYFVAPSYSSFVSIRLTGQDIPGTIRAIAATWNRTNNGQPLNELFLSQFRSSLYLDLIIQGVTIAIGAGLAVLIACLGLFALSAYTTERRTKEIGIRKVMGGTTLDVVRLLLWQFTIPVLGASAIAIPVGFLAMNWWLQGFTYHVELSVWTFVLAAVAAVIIAWLTVSYQSFMVARAKPAGAFRYE
jgi:putative ABC transport system permease protein